MPEKINELNIQKAKEVIPGDEKQSREGPEMIEGEELNKITTNISEIKEKIDHDQPITEKKILELKENINNLTIDIGGEKMPIKEIKNIKDLKRNVEIFKEIETGNFENHRKLTFITSKIVDKVTESLDKHKRKWLILSDLTFLSDNVAKSLSKYKGGWLRLDGLTSISDNAAESLSKQKGGYLNLYGLILLSDNAAKSLSGHESLDVPDNIRQQINKFKT